MALQGFWNILDSYWGDQHAAGTNPAPGPGAPPGPPPPPAGPSGASEHAAGPSDAAAPSDAASSNPAPVADGDESAEVADGDENASHPDGYENDSEDEYATLGDDESGSEVDDDMVDDVGHGETGETSVVSVPSGETSMAVISNDEVSNSEVPCPTAPSSSARAPDNAHEPHPEPPAASCPASTEDRKKELEVKIAALHLRLGFLSDKHLN